MLLDLLATYVSIADNDSSQSRNVLQSYCRHLPLSFIITLDSVVISKTINKGGSKHNYTHILKYVDMIIYCNTDKV